MSDRSANQRGLTLPELLIALLVFSMISAAAVYALRLTLDGRQQLQETHSRVSEVLIARSIIRNDLYRVTPRSVRDEFGTPLQGAMIGGLPPSTSPIVEGETFLVAFVRRGRSNLGFASPRSNLQFVEYVSRGTTLVRRVRPYLDDARDQPRQERVLLTGISAVRIAFLAGETTRGLEWSEVWPSTGGGRFAPTAVRLTIVTQRDGEVDHLFWIGELAGGPEAPI